jgi:DNA-binding transcriptional ArsR family regulator
MPEFTDHVREYVLREIKPPPKQSVEQDLEWICRVMGITGNRDKNQTSAKIFKELVYACKTYKPVNIEEISENLKITRTAVLHHLKTMMERGIVIKRKNYFELRTTNLESLLEEIFRDIERALQKARKIAEEVDRELELPVR